ncbi:hypothetical protein MYX76_01735 [Desulfobacterota bacterium AH_259_B03_O07]|nr:hypothetical protein [Desulfobacterota bacterium AH_259_B03_O07]
MNRIPRFIIGIAVFLLVIQPMGQIFAADPLEAKLEVRNSDVTIVYPDGSVFVLDVGARIPIFPGTMVITDETGNAVIKAQDCLYNIRDRSEVIVREIEGGKPGLEVAEGKQGEVCYCCSQKGDFLIDTIPADTKNYKGPATASSTGPAASSPTENHGTAIYLKGTAYTKVTGGRAEFNGKPLEPGEAACKPSCDNPYEPFGLREPCCPTDFLPLYLTGAAISAAATGGILGAAINGDGEGTDFLP